MENDSNHGDLPGAVNRRKFLKAGASSALAMSLAGPLAACGSSSSESTTTKKAAGSTTLRVGIPGDPATLDPEFAQDFPGMELVKNINAPWMRYDTTDSGSGYTRADLTKPLVPVPFESVVEDGSTVRYKVKPGLVLPSGAPLNADTFIFKAHRALGSKANSAFVWNILGMTEPEQIAKISDLEFEFRMPRPSSIVDVVMHDQDAGLVDPAVVTANKTAKDPWAHEFISKKGAATGPYVVQSFEPGNRVVLKAHPKYWGPKPNFQNVILQVIPQPESAVLFLKRGAIDVIQGLSLDKAAELKSASGVKVISAPSTLQDVLTFVVNKPPFNDVRVRRALAYAIPWDQLVKEVLKGEGERPKGVYSSRSVWFAKDAPWPYTYDPQKAKQLLAEAGHPNGFSFTLEVGQADAQSKLHTVPLQSAHAEIGVQAKIQSSAPATFSADRSKGEGQAFIMSRFAPFVDDPYFLNNLVWQSKAFVNWSKINDPRIDKLNGQLAGATDRAAKQGYARDLQVILNEIVTQIPLADVNRLVPMRDSLGGYLDEPDGLLTYGAFKEDSGA